MADLPDPLDIDADAPATIADSLNEQGAGIAIVAIASFLGIGFAFVVEHLQKKELQKEGSNGQLLATLSTIIVFMRGIGIGTLIR